MPEYSSFVALGDSFTEGMNDELPDGTFLGWADRIAVMLAEDNPDFAYANTAVRGKTLGAIIDEQLPIALEVRPDLVAVCAGGNDILVPGTNVDDVAARFDDMIRQLTKAGIDVVVFTGPDMREVSVVNRIRYRVALYNAHLHATVARYDTRVVDLWAMDVLRDPRAFCEDRLHFSTEAHRRIALRTAEVLGIETKADWREPWPEVEQPNWLTMRRSDIEWTKTHLLPWIGRHLRRSSAGDGLRPKRPNLEPFVPNARHGGRTPTNGNGSEAMATASGE
ncbi:MAG: SGNH/GDSL hydrolase family protein [Actinophytocola sp.]|nr:SGNH/GDSL hydrolase family protein [Actinophytocola sp.]